MPEQQEYKVQLEIFEGPLDLLLYLIKKDEVDIYNIPIERITTQYMEYLDLMRMLDLNIAGEFIVMAATLMMIKSRMLLPVEERPELEEEEADPRWDLVRQLVEYKKFKDAAALLQQREMFQENVFGIGGQNVIIQPEDQGVVLQDVSLFDLIAAFNDVLKRARPEEIGEIHAHQYTVADKIDAILHVIAARRTIPFGSLFPVGAHRHEIACTFLALLELIRLRQIGCTQGQHFGEILIHAVEKSVPVEPPASELEVEPVPATVAEEPAAVPEPEAEPQIEVTDDSESVQTMEDGIGDVEEPDSPEQPVPMERTIGPASKGPVLVPAEDVPVDEMPGVWVDDEPVAPEIPTDANREEDDVK